MKTFDGIRKVNAGLTNDPSSPLKILNKSPYFNPSIESERTHAIKTDDALFLLSKIPDFVDIMALNGDIYESEYPKVFSERPHVDNTIAPVEGRMMMADLTVNRKRALILSSLEFSEKENMKKMTKKVRDLIRRFSFPNTSRKFPS